MAEFPKHTDLGRILITGANGFVGRPLVEKLLMDGHSVTAAIGTGLPEPVSDAVRVDLDLGQDEPFAELDMREFGAVVHLAAASSSADAARDPVKTWDVNVVGTVKLLQALAEVVRGGGDPLLLLVSTGDVYPADMETPRDEKSEAVPANPYVASKLSAEIAAFEVARRTGLKLIVARPFPHSGAGQDTRFVVPDFVAKVLAAKQKGEETITVGNMNVVRELLHVSDVVDAYSRLLNDGAPGEVYNIARGTAVSLNDLLSRICEICDHQVVPVSRSREVNGAPSYLTGNNSKLCKATGWTPSVSFDDVVRDVVAGQLRDSDLD
jgi:GDP-4-dehydro-6-deoxy-D-mannose reductase